MKLQVETMESKYFIRFFKINHYCIEVNSKEITHEESIIQPGPNVNSLNWILGHIILSRNSIFKLLNKPSIWPDSHDVFYKRGSSLNQNKDNFLDFNQLLKDFDQTQNLLKKYLGGLTVEDFEKPVNEKETLAQSLSFLQFHESYHVGQTGILRKLLGKEGAIK